MGKRETAVRKEEKKEERKEEKKEERKEEQERKEMIRERDDFHRQDANLTLRINFCSEYCNLIKLRWEWKCYHKQQHIYLLLLIIKLDANKFMVAEEKRECHLRTLSVKDNNVRR